VCFGLCHDWEENQPKRLCVEPRLCTDHYGTFRRRRLPPPTPARRYCIGRSISPVLITGVRSLTVARREADMRCRPLLQQTRVPRSRRDSASPARRARLLPRIDERWEIRTTRRRRNCPRHAGHARRTSSVGRGERKKLAASAVRRTNKMRKVVARPSGLVCRSARRERGKTTGAAHENRKLKTPGASPFGSMFRRVVGCRAPRVRGRLLRLPTQGGSVPGTGSDSEVEGACFHGAAS
jgi:hypothetical protein